MKVEKRSVDAMRSAPKYVESFGGRVKRVGCELLSFEG
jgi:hypothetical protein